MPFRSLLPFLLELLPTGLPLAVLLAVLLADPLAVPLDLLLGLRHPLALDFKNHALPTGSVVPSDAFPASVSERHREPAFQPSPLIIEVRVI